MEEENKDCVIRGGEIEAGEAGRTPCHPKCQRDPCLPEELPSEGGLSREGSPLAALWSPISHPFFQGLDWAALAARKIPAPFRPQIRSELDVGNFAEEFTRLEPVYSPPGSPPPGDPRIFQVSGSSRDPRCRQAGCCQPRPG